MITDPTCLILGAGASVEYDFPTGSDLREYVTTRLLAKPGATASGGKLTEAIRSAVNVLPDKMQQFAERLMASGAPSIDFFLENNEEFAPIGKAAIAAALIQFENPQRLFYSKGAPSSWLQRKDEEREGDIDPSYAFTYSRHGWYTRLWNALCACRGHEEFLQNKLRIVTFNYERSLEHFLWTRYVGMFGPKVTPKELFECIRIVHVHGTLGRYPDGEPGSRPYAPEASQKAIRSAIQSISIHSDHFDDAISKEVSEVLGWAKKVVFLGFGFHPANVEKLINGGGFGSKKDEIFAGIYEKREPNDPEIRRINNLLMKYHKSAERPVVIGACEQVLRQARVI